MTVSSIQQELQNLQQEYILTKPSEILAFLTTESTILEFLKEASVRIKKYFPDEQLFLAIAPGSNGTTEIGLIISIYPAGNLPEILAKSNQFKKDWWLAAYNRIDRKVNLNLKHKDLSDTTGNAWDVLKRLTGTVEAPPDWSQEHDHYLYGTPKRYEE